MSLGYRFIRDTSAGASASGTPHGWEEGILGKMPMQAERVILGQCCRDWFLRSVEPWLEQGKTFHGLDLRSILLMESQTPAEYIASMKPPITARDQWGGFAEAVVISHAWKVQVAIWAEDTDGFFMLIDPLGPAACAEHQRISLVWKQTHYDILVVPASDWQRALS